MNQGRPKKVRYIQKMPLVRQFSPRGKPGRPEEVVLHIDEFEALKLTDFQMFSQGEGALAMKLSRASFGRAVREARRKIADALVNGKIIKIQMGDAQIGVRQREFTRDSLGKRPGVDIAPQIKNLVNATHGLLVTKDKDVL
ncbi:MAG: DUF134 domain-containing protein [Candidatus Omnitrophica bacterium]|nr:DUF134 domain-containing protein [Candidatus Omnitrophota bacterium]